MQYNQAFRLKIPNVVENDTLRLTYSINFFTRKKSNLQYVPHK